MNNDTMYSFMDSDFEAPVYEKSATPFETPHSNRDDLSKPYSNGAQFQAKVDSAKTDSEPKTSAAIEFWRYFSRQITDNHIAKLVNMEFNRDALADYQKEKTAYIKRYNQIKGELK